MSLAGLLLCILLPWAAGYSLLRAAEPGATGSAAFCRHVGHGYFLGLMLAWASLLAVNGVLGRPAIAPVLVTLALVCIAAGLWVRRRASSEAAPVQPAVSTARAGGLPNWLLYLLLTWASLHLLLALLHVLTVPVLPWDGWMVWVYRAKVWFFADSLLELVHHTRWLPAADVRVFTMPAVEYPGFASFVPFWAAKGLGEWSETLVLLPGWFAGLALALALYGQGRASGLALLPALLAVCLLLSTPLLGTHVALGGYADIWVAGYSGLGFIALIRGLGERHAGQGLLGLGFLLLGLAVKAEGLVWLLGAGGLAVCLLLPARLLLWGMLAAGLALLLAWITGWHYLPLPGGQGIGLRGGEWVLPFAGKYSLGWYNSWPSYAQAWFVQGSWNLLGLFLLLGLVAGSYCLWRDRATAVKGAAVAGGPARVRACLALLLLIAAMQFAIFFLSTQGEWAKTLTAINRLPLQFLPAILFVLAQLATQLWPAWQSEAQR